MKIARRRAAAFTPINFTHRFFGPPVQVIRAIEQFEKKRLSALSMAADTRSEYSNVWRR
jgi:hypothetical protein